MPKDLGQWGFLALIILIAAPLIFWLGSLLFVWVRWLFVEKEKLNASYAVLEDFNGTITEKLPIKYSLGIDTPIEINIVDNEFKPVIKVLKNEEAKKGTHVLEYNATSLAKGVYFCQLVTDNQKITKKFIIG